MARIEKYSWVLLVPVFVLLVPAVPGSQVVEPGGWSIPDLKGLIPYSITIRKVDGVEKMVERFDTPQGGHVARISGNGKVFAYAVDRDREPPIDYLLLDPDGSGRFVKRLGPAEVYSIPEWISY